jgi:hypothetical protein
MRAVRGLLAAILAAGIVTMVAAQPGGGFGFGGQDVNTLVLTNTALQEEIKLTDAQKEKFKPALDKQAEMTKAFTDMFKGGKGGFDKEKFTELNEKRTKVAEEVKKIVDDTLTAEQKKRLKQISIQVMSFNVFNDPEAKGGKGGFGGFTSESQKALMKEVQDALKLSDTQKSTIKGVVADFNKERQEINKEAGIGGGFGMKGGKAPDPEKVEAANKKIDKLRKEAWGKIEEALDGTQKTAWKGLVGDAFDTSKLRPTIPKKD